MFVSLADLPVVGGDIDAAYLADALKRAGRATAVDRVAVESFADGRSSTPVFSLKSPAGSHVLKVFERQSWWSELSGHDCVEAGLWASGATRALPPPLVCPTIDLAFHAERQEYWMLMDDVSAGITPRGKFDETRLVWLIDALAPLHARYWGAADDLPLWPMAERSTMLAASVAAAGGRIEAEGWIATSLKRIPLYSAFVPLFLDVLPAADADFYLDHCEHRQPWLSALAALPTTFVQGDLRRANFAAFAADRVSLFDWDFAARAPAARDLAWYWFLQFWCYPPDDSLPEDREPLRLRYRDRLAAALGRKLAPEDFERAWQLSWLAVFAELGFLLIDPLTGQHEADDIARVRAVCARAFDEARRIYDAHVR